MTHGSLFSGIGGFDLAAEWAGWKNEFMCEIDHFCQKVLKYHFPKTKLYEDIKKTDFTEWNGRIDVVSGGFPCQPFSVAGKRKGTDDDRFLWKEMLRAICDVQPAWVVAENVYGLITQQQGMVFDRVCADLEAVGYEVQPFIVPACAVNAPHRRDRIWIVAHRADAGIKNVQPTGKNGVYEPENSSNTKSNRLSITGNARAGRNGFEDNSPHVSDPAIGRRIQNNKKQQSGQFKQDIPNWRNFPTQSPVCGRNDGFSGIVDIVALYGKRAREPYIRFSKWKQESIKSFGSAIVPQVAYENFKIIDEIETQFLTNKIEKK